MVRTLLTFTTSSRSTTAQAGFAIFSGGAPPNLVLQSVLTMPRPLGLPVEEGYTLQLIPNDLSPDLVARIPEGQIVTLTPDMLATGGK